jgi:hypothetical protein
MFEIKVNSAFFLSNINTVAIEGDVIVEGDLKKGAILIDKNDSNKIYKTKGIYFVDGPSVVISMKKLNLQLEPGDYKAEDLIGKTLISK